ncbi:MAG: hypothetical protein JWM31_1873 [Solirubrobacterales bacterium]|nr:hypothetical protein [Solirubrobacterales bacterium]
MSESRPSTGRRLSVITIDQAIAGASNVLIAVLAARLLDVASFGLFGLVFLVYMLIQGVARALVCDPLLVHPVEGAERAGEVMGTSAGLGAALAALVLVVGTGAELLDARLGDALLILGVCVPLLVLQDLGRYLGFAFDRPSSALLLDVVWLVLLVAGVGLLAATDARSLPWFIAAWAGSGALSGCLCLWRERRIGVRFGLAWLRYTWSFSWRYLVSYTSTIGSALAGSVAVGGIAGAKALGALQAVLLLVRPYSTFQVAAVAASVGEVARVAAEGRRVRRQVVRITMLTTGVALINAVLLLDLPHSHGTIVLGDSWRAVKPLLLATGVQIVILGATTGVRAGLLGMRAIREVMLIDVVATAVLMIATVPGAVVDGARGAVWAVSMVQVVMAFVWWVMLWRRTRPSAPVVPAPLPAITVPHPPLA